MNSASNQKKKEYFLEGIKLLLHDGENIDNFLNVLKEYEDALQNRQLIIDNLFEEVKKIKQLKL